MPRWRGPARWPRLPHLIQAGGEVEVGRWRSGHLDHDHTFSRDGVSKSEVTGWTMSGCATSLDVLERLIGVSTKPGATAFTQMPEVADVAMTMFIHVFFRPGGNERPDEEERVEPKAEEES